MGGMARKAMSFFDIQKKLSELQKETEAQARIIAAGARFDNSPPQSQAGGQAVSRDTTAVKIEGNVIKSILGYQGQSRAISSGELALDLDATGADSPERTVVFVSPESGTTDTLDTITGNVPTGAVIYLSGVSGNTITISHNNGGTGGILCPADQAFSLEDDDVVILIQDQTAGTLTWRLFGASLPTEIVDGDTKVVVEDLGGSGSSIKFFVDGIVTPEISIDEDEMLINDVDIELNQRKILGENNADTWIEDTTTGWDYAVGSSESHDIIVGSNTMLSIDSGGAVPHSTFEWGGDFIPDTDGIHDIGSSAKPWNRGYFDNTIFVNNIDEESAGNDINILADLDIQTGATCDFADTATSATAGSRTLPSNPVDFIIIKVNGTSRKVPFYAT